MVEPTPIRQEYERQLRASINREVRGARAFNRYALKADASNLPEVAAIFRRSRDRFMKRARQRWTEYHRSRNGTY